MKNKVKKTISLVVLVAIMLGCNVHAGAASAMSDIERATNVLLQSGWTQAQIDDLLTEEALLQYKDVQPAIVCETKYFRVNEEGFDEITKAECYNKVNEVYSLQAENEAAISPAATIPVGGTGSDEVETTDGYMEYYVSAFNAGNGQYILAARYEWLIPPYYRLEDVFGLGHDTNLTQLSDYEVYYVYKVDWLAHIGLTTTEGTDEYTEPNEISIDNGGTVVSQDLSDSTSSMSGDGVSFYNHRGYLQYRVAVNNPNVTTVAVYAEYLHQQTLFSVSPSISYPAGASISVSSESKFKRMSPNPYLSFEVE